MNNVIKAIELIGQNSNLDNQEVLLNELKELSLSSEELQILLEKDVPSLEKLLNADHKIFCGIAPAEDDKGDDEDESEPEEDSSEKAIINW